MLLDCGRLKLFYCEEAGVVVEMPVLLAFEEVGEIGLWRQIQWHCEGGDVVVEVAVLWPFEEGGVIGYW